MSVMLKGQPYELPDPSDVAQAIIDKLGAAGSYEDGTAYDHLAEEDFHGLYCACGRRMHASDTECERCWREREYPELLS